MSSLLTGVSGLRNHQVWLDVIGDNIGPVRGRTGEVDNETGALPGRTGAVGGQR